MRPPNDIFCLIWKRWAGKDALADSLHIPKVTISDILTQYCKQHNLQPDRNTLTQLWNSVFDWQTLARKLQESLPQWWIITGLRKPETLYHLMEHQRCLLIWVFADDYLRWQRVTQRNRLGDRMSYRHFLEHERQENSPPNQQNINLLTAFCDLHIKNNESLDSYIIQWTQALQKVLKRPHSQHHIDASWYIHFTRAILINEFDEILVMYDTNKKIYTLPWWKVDAWETPDVTILRELQEEIDVNTKLDYCGSFAGLFHDWLWKWHFFEWVVPKECITILEPEKHSEHRWIPRKELNQTLWFTTFLDTWLYHYTYNQRVHNRDVTRAYEIDNHPHSEYIQYMDPSTGVIHVWPWGGSLDPLCMPLRIMSYEKIHEGLWKQEERIGNL
jgi:ADP-ribose pyrophosphatase YjhB (NUDIX family)